MKRKYTYFGYIDSDINFEQKSTKVSINNNFSSYLIEFQINGVVKSIEYIIDDCIFIFTGTNLFAFKEENEKLYKIEKNLNQELTNLVIDSSIWKWNLYETNTFSKKKLDFSTFNKHFAHWEEYSKCFFDKPSSTKTFTYEKEILICTLFSAYIIENDESKDCAKLEKIYESRKTINNDFKKHKIDSRIRKACAGNDHIALYTINGDVYTCGTGIHGELGNGTIESSTEPLCVEMFNEALITVTDISAGAWHTCVLTDEGDVYGWGWNSCGQLGYLPEEFTVQPFPHPFEVEKKVVSIACRNNLSNFVFEDGSKAVYGK